MAGINLYHRITNRDDNSINLYFKDVNKYKLLTPEEEKELTLSIRDLIYKISETNDRIVKNKLEKELEVKKNKLITSNLRFVITVAKQYQGKGLPLGDLINEGNRGLINSIDKFDPEKGFRFMSYSIWWVRQAIVQALSNTSRMIRVPYTKASSLYKVMVAKGQFEQTYGREPTMEELSSKLHMTEKDIKDILAAPKYVSSLETPFTSDEESGSLLDITPNKNVENSDHLVSNSDSQHFVHLLLDKLDDRTYDVMVLFFGLFGVEKLTLKDIGTRFNVTEERIRQIKNKTLKKLEGRYSKYIKEFL